MTQRNCRGAYYSPVHDRPQDWDFLAKWQPNVIRLMLPGDHNNPSSIDVGRIERVHQTCPDATILLRCWDVDDRNFEAHDAMVADPKGEAARQVNYWSAVFDRCTGVPRGHLMAGLNNETGPEKDGPLLAYTQEALHLGIEKAVRLCVYIFSVGRPSLTGEAEIDMADFEQLDAIISLNHGAVGLNEYMQPEGMYAVWTDAEGKERKDFTYLINRHARWAIKSDIIISEWGLDGLLYNRHPDPKYGNSGWRNFQQLWTPDRFADEYVECIRVASDNVIAICPFISDWNDHKWQSFDMVDAYPQLIARKDKCVKPISDAPPVVTPPIVIPPATDTWRRSIDFVLRWEGGYVDNPADPGGATNMGITMNTYTRWCQAHGQPSPTKDDLRNLTSEEAKQIYFEWYWLPSHSDSMVWPLCLANFDTAVNAGVGRSEEMLQKSGDNFNAYMGNVIDWYTRIAGFDTFGKAWIRRRADLLLEAAK